MDAIDRKASDLSSPDRAALEHLLGRPLSADDHVVVVAYQPQAGREIAREAARSRIRATLERGAQHAASEGITADEADAAIEEAMAAIRLRTAT